MSGRWEEGEGEGSGGVYNQEENCCIGKMVGIQYTWEGLMIILLDTHEFLPPSLSHRRVPCVSDPAVTGNHANLKYIHVCIPLPSDHVHSFIL